MANWLSRSTDTPPPRRRRRGDRFDPVPTALQTALPSDLTVVDMTKRGFTLGDVRDAHPYDERRDIGAGTRGILERILGRIGIHSQVLTNFRADVGVIEETIIPYNPMRAYLFMVNTGAAEVRIAFDRAADTNTGVPIASGGFFEPILGTVSSMHAVAAVANQELVIVEGFYTWGRWRGGR